MRWSWPESTVTKKLAKYSFLFFLIKGLLWLTVPLLIAVFFGAD
jgi:hypothetical protein